MLKAYSIACQSFTYELFLQLLFSEWCVAIEQTHKYALYARNGTAYLLVLDNSTG